MDEDPDYIEPAEFKRRLKAGKPTDARGGKRPRMIKDEAPSEGITMKSGPGGVFSAVSVSRGIRVTSTADTPINRR